MEVNCNVDQLATDRQTEIYYSTIHALKLFYFDYNTLILDIKAVDSFRFSQPSAIVRPNPTKFLGYNTRIWYKKKTKKKQQQQKKKKQQKKKTTTTTKKNKKQKTTTTTTKKKKKKKEKKKKKKKKKKKRKTTLQSLTSKKRQKTSEKKYYKRHDKAALRAKICRPVICCRMKQLISAAYIGVLC